LKTEWKAVNTGIRQGCDLYLSLSSYKGN